RGRATDRARGLGLEDAAQHRVATERKLARFGLAAGDGPTHTGACLARVGLGAGVAVVTCRAIREDGTNPVHLRARGDAARHAVVGVVTAAGGLATDAVHAMARVAVFV